MQNFTLPSVLLWDCGFVNLFSLFVCTVYSDISFQCAVHVLWWYESADQRAAMRQKAHGDARVVAAGKYYYSRQYCTVIMRAFWDFYVLLFA